MKERKSLYGLIFAQCANFFYSTTSRNLLSNLLNDENDPRFQKLIDSDASFLLHPAKLSHILELTVYCKSKNIMFEALLIA